MADAVADVGDKDDDDNDKDDDYNEIGIYSCSICQLQIYDADDDAGDADGHLIRYCLNLISDWVGEMAKPSLSGPGVRSQISWLDIMVTTILLNVNYINAIGEIRLIDYLIV